MRTSLTSGRGGDEVLEKARKALRATKCRIMTSELGATERTDVRKPLPATQNVENYACLSNLPTLFFTMPTDDGRTFFLLPSVAIRSQALDNNCQRFPNRLAENVDDAPRRPVGFEPRTICSRVS